MSSPAAGIVLLIQLPVSSHFVLLIASSPLQVAVDMTTRTSRASSPIATRGRRLGPPRRPPPGQSKATLAAVKYRHGQTPFQGNSSGGHEPMAPSSSHPASGAERHTAFHQTILQRLEYIYHGKFTCFYKVNVALMYHPTDSTRGRMRLT